jgi:hypothetical protein
MFLPLQKFNMFMPRTNLCFKCKNTLPPLFSWLKKPILTLALTPTQQCPPQLTNAYIRPPILAMCCRFVHYTVHCTICRERTKNNENNTPNAGPSIYFSYAGIVRVGCMTATHTRRDLSSDSVHYCTYVQFDAQRWTQRTRRRAKTQASTATTQQRTKQQPCCK